jgi:hypothetical protein
MIFDEESEADSTARFDQETAEVDSPIEPEGEVIPPPHGDDTAEDSFPLEALITPAICGLILSMPGMIQAKRTGHEWWKLDEEEKQLLGEASQPLAVYLVRKYLGEGVGMFAAAAVALTAVYAPRQIREMQEARDPASSAQSQPTPRSSQGGSRPSSVSEDAGSQSSSGDFSVPFRE